MIVIVIAALLLCCCASFQPTAEPDVLPHLIHRVSFPPWPYASTSPEIAIDIKIRITKEGSVSDALLLTPSGSDEWDSLTLAAVRQWQFSPALVDGAPVSLWIRQTVRIHFEEPTTISIAEIVCSERRLADSLYTLLVSGMPFDSLARMFSISASREQGGVVGPVDLHALPLVIRHELTTLSEGDITKPLARGSQFVIYKRLPRST